MLRRSRCVQIFFLNRHVNCLPPNRLIRVQASSIKISRSRIHYMIGDGVQARNERHHKTINLDRFRESGVSGAAIKCLCIFSRIHTWRLTPLGPLNPTMMRPLCSDCGAGAQLAVHPRRLLSNRGCKHPSPKQIGNFANSQHYLIGLSNCKTNLKFCEFAYSDVPKFAA